jgi:hypothetical protein
MILDAYGRLAADQTLTASGASTNVLDFGLLQKDLGPGEGLTILVHVLSLPAAGGTYTVGLRTSDTLSGSALGGSPVTLLTRTIGATSPAGSQFEVPIPKDLYNAAAGKGLLEYLDLYFTLGGSNPSLEIAAELVPSKFQQEYNGNLASGFTIE